MPRNDQRFAEDIALSLVIYADENGLSVEDGLDLAEAVRDVCIDYAADRADYVDA